MALQAIAHGAEAPRLIQRRGSSNLKLRSPIWAAPTSRGDMGIAIARQGHRGLDDHLRLMTSSDDLAGTGGRGRHSLIWLHQAFTAAASGWPALPI